MKRLKGLQDYVEKIDHLKDSYEEMEMLIEMSEEEQLALLATDGMLVKRPILVAEDKILVGAKEKEWEEYLMP